MPALEKGKKNNAPWISAGTIKEIDTQRASKSPVSYLGPREGGGKIGNLQLRGSAAVNFDVNEGKKRRTQEWEKWGEVISLQAGKGASLRGYGV